MTSFSTSPPAPAWPPPPAPPTAPAGRPAPRFPDEGTWPPAGYRSADQRTAWATGLHALAALATLASAFVVAQVFGLLDKLDRFQLTAAEEESWFSSVELTSNLETWASLLAIISLMTWLSRSVDNTPSLGGGIARRGPRWAIGAWFIPIVNFVMPALIMRDLARRVSPDRKGHGKLVLAWWLLYWLPVVLAFYTFFIPIQGTDSVREQYAWTIAVQLVNALGYIMTIVVMRRLQRDADYWHDKRRAEWQAAANAASFASPQASSSWTPGPPEDSDTTGWPTR
jgi:uncharacterized membrane protein YjfL (UPF0719 family)